MTYTNATHGAPQEAPPLSSVAQAALYFQTATSAPAGTRRLLLMSYTFPPDPAVGGLRWQQMAGYFADHGWSIDVIARDFARVEDLDKARLERLPPGTRIFTVPDREPLLAKVQKVVWRPIRRVVGHLKTPANALALSLPEMKEQRGARTFVRTYLAAMDVARGRNWAHAAARLASEMARTQGYVAVVTSGPPHMVHEGGRLASIETGLPHVVDMRDPWSLVHRLQENIASPLWLRLATRYERRVMSHATLVTLNTEPTRSAMEVAYSQHAHKLAVVRNGSDTDPLPPTKRDTRFRIRFAGSIYLDRDPRTFFRAAKRLITELNLTPQQFLIEFIGQVYRYAGTPTLLIAQEEGIKDYVRVSGIVPRRQALDFLAGATMLLSLPQDSDYAIPAKLYEYVRFEAWMLVLATPGSATGQLMQDTEADVVEHENVDEIARVLRQRYAQFVSGERPAPIGRDGRFDRTRQAKKMMDLIVEHCMPAAERPVSAPQTPESLRQRRQTPI